MVLLTVIPAYCQLTLYVGFQWTADVSHLERRLYRPVLGISFRGVDLESLDSLIFYIGVDSPSFVNVSQPYIEIITKRQLKKMYSQKGICRWRLHRQFDNSKREGPVRPLLIKMDICRSVAPPCKTNQEFLELHYFELHSCSAENISDVLFHDHIPYLWSIDIEHKESPTDLGQIRSTKIVHYAVSGNGRHAITLSATDRHLYMDLWDLSCAINSTPVATSVKEQWSNPTWSAGTSMPFCNSIPDSSGKPILVNAAVSVSWSGVYVALFPTTGDSCLEKSVIYKCSPSLSLKVLKNNTDTPTSIVNMQRCNDLPSFCGEGTFHIADTKHPLERNELFITCNGESIQIYEIHRAWSLMCTVPLGAGPSLFTGGAGPSLFPGGSAMTLQGKYLSWFQSEGQAFIWNIEARALSNVVVTSRKGPPLMRFSSDGSKMVISQGGTITTYWTESGTAIGTYKLPFQTYASGLTFVRDDTHILIDWSSDRDWSQGTFGYILDAATMTQLDKFSYPGRYTRGNQRVGASSQQLYSCHGSTLNLFDLEDYIFDPHSPSTCRCSQDNWDDFFALAEDIAFTTTSGLLFTCNFIRPSDEAVGDTHAFSLEVSEHGLKRELIRFPSYALTERRPYKSYYKTAHFLKSLSQLLLYSDEVVMVLSLPETFDGECNILQIHWLQDKTFRHGNDHALQLEEQYGLLCCKHQKHLLFGLYHYDISDQAVIVQVPLDRPAYSDQGFKFVNAIMALVEIYKVAESLCRQAILRYLGLHINTYLNSENLLDSVVGKIIEAWSTTDHKICEEMLASLLTSENIQWIPRPDYTQRNNPLYVLLELSRKAPLAMGLANIIMMYCLRKSKEQEDYLYISLLVSCLPELCDDRRPHQEIALDVLRAMAYVPVKHSSYSYIIDNHIIAHPPEVRWPFWKRNKRPLHKCDDPVLQLHLSAEPHDSQLDNFGKRIFVAPFGMLWKVDEEALMQELHAIEASSWLRKTWISTLVSMIWYSCSPGRRAYVRHHNAFSLSVFDNPALATLVEYKWNTIGYQYWLTRFLVQCAYYLLVLTAVYVQIYESQESIRLVYIAIIIFSGIFLWLEFVQFIQNSSQYYTSPYNLVDLAVFALPLAASIKRIVKDPSADITDFSFSVLFVFLHLVGSSDATGFWPFINAALYSIDY
ncbi:hypothetical protein EDD11_005926 [Mortierella claussenii]|nr:hypothetical protein EDD11_005926 [Mortierella claussenii]